MNDYKFGNFICLLRTEKGLSQSQLGNMLGVTNKAVSKWEMGVSKPRPDMLVTLATFFGVTIEELLAGERNVETEKQDLKESKDNTIKLWTDEYLKKKKRGNIAVIMAFIIPIILFIFVGVISSINSGDKIWEPIIAMVIIFVEGVDIVLAFVFYSSARRLKRILYANYHEQAEEITAIISKKKEKKSHMKEKVSQKEENTLQKEEQFSPKKEKVPMLKWEKICSIISSSIIALCAILRFILLCLNKQANILQLINFIVMCLAGILAIIVLIHYYIRVYNILKQRK